MANRVFQSVIYQMKDAIDRVVGVVDETGAVISCSELNLIGEVREGFMAERLTAGDRFVRDGYTYQQFSSAKHNDYAVFVEGADETAGQFAALLSISLQSIKQYHDEKFDKSNFIKNVVLDNILPGDIYAKARELHFATDVSRVVFIVRVTSGGDISAYDVVSSLFPDKQKDFVFNISETDTVLVKEIRKGIDRTDIGDVYTDPENPVELEPIEIDPPTLSIVFEASTSPLVGRDGDIVGARQLKERLFNEAENNVTMKIEELEDKSGVEVSGRGILHLSVLMESMRREGFEFQVGRPRVLFKKDENGNKMEPVEQAVVECPDEYSGKVVEVFGTSGGIMTSMDTSGIVTHLEFKIPTRGIMGLKNRIMNVTHGEGVFYHTFLEYGPYAGEIGNRQNGAMISMTTEKAVAYALGTLQERGQLFIGAGVPVYAGMVVGVSPKQEDITVNVCKKKQLTNTRAAGSDDALRLVPPRKLSLEQSLEFLADDELLEVTPKSLRIRKRILDHERRMKAAHGKGAK